MSILGSPVAKLMLGMLFAVTSAYAAAPDAEALARGIALRNSGSLQQAIDYFGTLRARGDEASGIAATGELGNTLLQARRYDEAEPLLREAYNKTAGRERARYAIELGNLSAARRKPQDALRFYAEARTLAASESAIALVARIDEARLIALPARPALLLALSRDLDGISEPLARARMRLSVGTLAGEAGSLQTAYENFDEARTLATQAGNVRFEVEAIDGLAQLYESQGRNAEALSLSLRGSTRAQEANGMFADIQLRLEWRQGRLLAAQGATEGARAAYQRAIEHIEGIRQDIPIEYEGGRSSFHDTLEPIYLGYIDLLLKKADTADGSERTDLLRRTRDIAELIKQSELQDYLGERCSVDSMQNAAQVGVAPGTAIFYPIVLNDRIEVIFESGAGINRHTTSLDASALRRLVMSYTSLLRDGKDGYRNDSNRLYDILIRPFEKEIDAQGVHTLLVVPDGVLRLLPWTTLHDGKRFIVEKYSVVINSGLSMTSHTASRTEGYSSLIAGMAKPGPVVEKFANNSLAKVVDPSATRAGFVKDLARSGSLRTLAVIPNNSETQVVTASSSERIAELKENLALPGVKTEIDALSKILPGTSLLDGTFTTARLHDEFDKRGFRIIHFATHGFFGSTADQSFIMAYDDYVTMDGLQKLLQLEGVKKGPIELLTLSACETAEGDDRSPLGIAGAAIKAKAKSVLGTLWPVSDDAAQQVMTNFYNSLVHDGVSKAEALRRAQVALIGNPKLDHPFYWAPFIIVGNWR